MIFLQSILIVRILSWDLAWLVAQNSFMFSAEFMRILWRDHTDSNGIIFFAWGTVIAINTLFDFDELHWRALCNPSLVQSLQAIFEHLLEEWFGVRFHPFNVDFVLTHFPPARNNQISTSLLIDFSQKVPQMLLKLDKLIFVEHH